MKYKISLFSVVTIFTVLFTVLPSYFTIAGVAVRNLLILGVFAVLLLSIVKNGLRIKLSINKNSYIFLFLWVVTLSGIAFIHGAVMAALLRLILWLVLGFVFIQMINTKERFLKIIDFLIYTAAIVALLGIVEEVTHFNVFFLFNNSGSTVAHMLRMRMGILRLISFTSHPITYCVYCMFILSFIFYRITIPGTKHIKLLKVIYGLVMVNALLTVSRSAILCLLLCQVLLLWFCGLRRFIIKALQIGIGIVVVVGILWIISSKVRELVQVVYYMIMAVFSDEYASLLSKVGFEGNNTNGIGQRFQLYPWVWEEVKNNLLIGFGPTSNIARHFTNSAGYLQLKQSIEVQFLLQLYRYGILGMLTEVVFYLSLLFKTFSKTNPQHASWEGKLSFQNMCKALIIAYILVLFAVMQNEDAQIFFWLVILLMSYTAHYKFQKTNVVMI